MHSCRCHRNRRARQLQRTERGATLVEFALILPLLLALVLGVVEFGVNLHQAQSIRSATHSAARSAAVVANPPGSCSTAATGPTRDLVCDLRNRSGLDDVQVRLVLPDGWSKGAPLIVCSQRRNSDLTGFFPFLSEGTTTSRSEYRIEREGSDASDAPTAFSDDAPSGSDWNWCTA